ncbi:MAG: hypothetical protein AAF483_30940 [Planctomycetota bacterium]
MSLKPISFVATSLFLVLSFVELHASKPSSAGAVEGKLLFSDDFERSESDDSKEELGKGWGTNSKKRAGGNKQADSVDGTLHIVMHETADHAVSVTHEAEFKDGIVRLRFMLPTAKDSLGLNFADLKYKPVHAGHLCVARISPHTVKLQDLKTGNMDLKVREKRLAKQVWSRDDVFTAR